MRPTRAGLACSATASCKTAKKRARKKAERQQEVAETCCAPYWCPTAGEIECPRHGGFDTCCAAPELHVPVADLVPRPTPPSTGEMHPEYRRGAHDEARARIQGMRPDALDVYDYVTVCAQMGYRGPRIVSDVVFVFTADWSLRDRLALSWRLVTGR
jgi:hypothetical protein